MHALANPEEKRGALLSAPVSVVIPTYRDGQALQRALASIEKQTVQPSQIIVVDDASGDLNAEQACQASSVRNIQLVTLSENGGPGAARNAGISASQQAYVAFLDADDEWHPEKLQRQMSVMSGPEAPLFSCHKKSFNGTPWLQLAGAAAFSAIKPTSLLFSNPASISTVVMKKDAIKYGFPHTYAGEDYQFVAANILSGITAIALHETLARAHKDAYGAGGLSGKLYDMQLGEMKVRDFLLKEGLINIPQHGIALAWSMLKYLRRIAIVCFRRVTAKQS